MNEILEDLAGELYNDDGENLWLDEYGNLHLSLDFLIE